MNPTLVQIQYEWKQALEAPFDPAALAAIHDRYRAAREDAAEWSALCSEQQAIVDEERHAAREAAWEAHAQMSRGELIAAAGYSWNPQRTKRELLDEIAARAAERVEGTQSRVNRIWKERRRMAA